MQQKLYVPNLDHQNPTIYNKRLLSPPKSKSYVYLVELENKQISILPPASPEGSVLLTRPINHDIHHHHPQPPYLYRTFPNSHIHKVSTRYIHYPWACPALPCIGLSVSFIYFDSFILSYLPFSYSVHCLYIHTHTHTCNHL